MSRFCLKDLMVPVEHYASVSLDASLREGILALKQAQQRELREDPERHRDRAVLVKDSMGKIVGKLSMWSIIGCLEPNYGRIKGGSASSKAAARVGSARNAIQGMMESSHLWRSRLNTIANDTAPLRVKDLLHEFRPKELIDQNASVETAIHQLVSGHLMSLLVTTRGQIVGILRLVDVFEAVCDLIRPEDFQHASAHPDTSITE